VETWYAVMRAVRSFELRCRLKLLTWQELAGVVPDELREFLAEKYGIVASGPLGGKGFKGEGVVMRRLFASLVVEGERVRDVVCVAFLRAWVLRGLWVEARGGGGLESWAGPGRRCVAMRTR